jgi:integrase/recombinase XerD
LGPAKFVRRPKVSLDSQTLGLDWDEVSRLWKAAWRVGPREAALVGLLFFDGLRVSEACNAMLEQIGTYGDHVILKVRRKGGKENDVPLSPATQRAIAQLVGERDSGPVFQGNGRVFALP